MSKKEIFLTILVFIISFLILIICKNPETMYAKVLGVNNNKTPKQIYRVYLGKESIGYINSKKELDKYINEKQTEIKEKYNAKKVYAPNDLKIIKELTYNEKISTIEEIYNKIIDIKGTSSFTIDGYKIDLSGYERKTEEGEVIKKDDKTLYVLDKNIFDESVIKTVKAFVDEDDYNKYINKTQKELEESKTGYYIENIYISSTIKISKGRIPIDDNIFITSDDLARYLIFGTLEDQKKYTISSGDTIDLIANNNKLSVNEFLIANSDINSEKDLLYPGQVVNLGLISPQLQLVMEKTVQEEKTIERNVVYKNDSNQYSGYEKVESEGQDGLSLIKTLQHLVNGEIEDSVPISTTELIPSQDKVIVRGTKVRTYTSYSSDLPVPVDIGSWIWPTNSGYTISSKFEWRGNKHHDGIDICGVGYNSPIKAANNGIVVQSNYNGYNGNWITIKHSNGYYTYYGHLASRYKQTGDIVMAGDIIGGMGQSGYATGVHLHFGLSYGFPYRSGSYWVNPFRLY